MDRVPPKELKIWGFGKVETAKGSFVFDRQSATSVMREYQKAGTDICFDYEHKAVDPDARTGDGIAAGWCKLELRKDGLYAVDIKWTERAARQIAKAEWRYWSPAFNEDPKTGRILRLTNIALTNLPATYDLTPLVAASRRKMADEMTDAPAVNEVKKLQAENDELKKRLAEKEEDPAEDTEEADVNIVQKEEDPAEDTEEADVNIVQKEEDEDHEEPDGDEAMPQGKMAKLKKLMSAMLKCLEGDEPTEELEDDVEMDDTEAKDEEDLPPAKTSRSTRGVITLSDLSKTVGVKVRSRGEAVGVLKGLSESSRKSVKLQRRLDAVVAREHEARVDSAIREGKITPGQRSWALSVSPSVLGGYLKTSTVKTPKPHVEPHSTPVSAAGETVFVDGKPVTLSAEHIKHAKVAGLTKEECARLVAQTFKK